MLIPNVSSRHCENAIIQALEGPSRAAMTAGGAFRDLEEGTFAAEQQVLRKSFTVLPSSSYSSLLFGPTHQASVIAIM